MTRLKQCSVCLKRFPYNEVNTQLSSGGWCCEECWKTIEQKTKQKAHDDRMTHKPLFQ